MNFHKSPLRLIMVTQVFCLFFLILMPTLVRLLSGTLGKWLYTLMVLGALGLALALRYALDQVD